MSIRNRFIFSLIVSTPILINMVASPFGFGLPGGMWTQFLLTTAVMAVSGRAFIQSAWASFRHHHANMDTLVAIGTGTAIYIVFMQCLVTKTFLRRCSPCHHLNFIGPSF